ncbi:TPA: thermonuclease family protein [Klebsiella aerogenes]|uniref:thermonuclease family protein n=1 Tax=Klebsiella aerogenes TaxID=548 RepID=UPI00388FF119|nr:thermonuclease family protein [Klebsiella aerogenes]HDB9567250.1 thermonuclease family protein [Escherichia coli]
MNKLASFIVLMALSFSSLASATIEGTVTRVLDGDTVEVKTLPSNVLVTEAPIRVRLNGIDAPEKKQPYGQRSRQYLASLVGGKQITVAVDGQDRYHRTLGDVFVRQCKPECETVNVNAAMVTAGMAWAYRYHNVAVTPEMSALEATARSEKKGLWHDTLPIEPWKWREEHKE